MYYGGPYTASRKLLLRILSIELISSFRNESTNIEMAVRKRNDFLEGDTSDEEVENDYDSDEVEESRGTISNRANKRRKVEDASDDDSLVGVEEDAEDSRLETSYTRNDAIGIPAATHVGGNETADTEEDTDKRPKNPLLKPSTPKQVAAAQKAAYRTGVVYISRVPPFMKPQTLRHFLAPHAPKGIGRIFLTPEDHAAHTRRVRSGGNKKKSFTDGWVEFVSKREAKIAVETLNGNIIGGKKGNFYHDDLWNMKYLNGFKWSHLTEQIANENAERAARMREEVRRTRKENKAFVEDVERGKMLEGMETKRKARRQREVDGADDDAQKKKQGFEREFKQKAPQQLGRHDEASQKVSRLANMIM